VDLAAWFQELRRRRVIRALLAWGLFSFAVLQVVEPVQHALGLADWVLKVVVAVLALGFPLSAGLAWAFDLTRRGIERTAPPEGSEAAAAARREGVRPAVAMVAVGALLGAAVAGLAGWHLWGRSPAPGPDGRITVAVADFVNETKDGDLDGLSGQLITSLEQSQRLRVLTRSRMVDVLRQIGKPSVPVVDEILGREMALAAGVRALVVATIRRFDELYAIDVKVLDPATSEYFFTLKEEREGKAAIPAMLDRLSEKTREKLREAPAKVAAARIAVAESTTASHEAWRLYFDGLKRESEGDTWGATRSYEKAIAIDPRFAMAQYRIAWLGEFGGYPRKLMREAMEAALREIDRVPAKEKLLFRAWKAHLDGRDADAHALYAQAAEAYPLEKEVFYLAGNLYRLEGRAAEALPLLERAAALDPGWIPAEYSIIGDVLPALGRGEEGLARARRLAEERPGRMTQWLVRNALVATGRRNEAAEMVRTLSASDPSWDTEKRLANYLILADRFEEAEAILRRHATQKAPAEERLEVTWTLVAAVAAQGRRNEALRVAASLKDMPEAAFRGKAVQSHAIRWQLLMNERNHAAALREGEIFRGWNFGAGWLFTGYLIMGEDRLAAEVVQGSDEPLVRDLYPALVAWRRGDHATAIDAIRSIMANRPDDRTFLSWWIAYVAFDAGRDAEAIAATTVYENAFEQISAWRGWGLARLLYKKAEAQERMGDRAGAAATTERLLGWWTKADPDLPLLAETRALCRKLGCDAPQMVAARK